MPPDSECTQTPSEEVSTRRPTAQESPRTFILNSLEPLIRRKLSRADQLELRLDETGIDSLELMELVMATEDRFGIQINDNMITERITVDEFCRLIEGLYTAQQ